mmetsp:Transcript_54303/g.109007  ORF Transcript_54303/g.109007 Transcript_54303/m.109007 type:complete len:143 (-) Transcript_54303:157-585(-)
MLSGSNGQGPALPLQKVTHSTPRGASEDSRGRKQFQAVLNQWIPRPLSDRRLQSLARPKRELQEPDYSLPLSARSLDEARLSALAKPKSDRKELLPEPKSAVERRCVNMERLSALAQQPLRVPRRVTDPPPSRSRTRVVLRP